MAAASGVSADGVAADTLAVIHTPPIGFGAWRHREKGAGMMEEKSEKDDFLRFLPSLTSQLSFLPSSPIFPLPSLSLLTIQDIQRDDVKKRLDADVILKAGELGHPNIRLQKRQI